jgi:O-antigen/teichoic acid export membrane protein
MFVGRWLRLPFKSILLSLKKNLAYNFLLSISQVLFPLLSIPWLSRVLDPEGLGRVQFVDSLTYYFIVLAEAGIVTHAIREVARSRHDAVALRKLVSELLSLHLLTTLVASVLYAVAVFILYDKIADPRLLFFSGSFLLLNGFACEWYFWGREEFRFIAARSLLVRALALVSLFILVRRPEHYVVYYAIIAGSAVAILLWNVGRMISQVGISFKNLDWKKHLRVTRITYAVSIAYSIPLLLDNVLLGILSGTAVVAFYAYALKIVRLVAALITDTFLVLYPRTVSLLQSDDAIAVRRNLRLSSDGLLLLAFPAGMGIWLAADAFTNVYFGPGFAPVADHLKILSVFPFFMTAALYLNKQILMPRNQERQVLLGLIAGAMVFAITAFWFCSGWGSRGMAWALIASEATVTIVLFFLARKTSPGLLEFRAKTWTAAIFTCILFYADGLALGALGLPGIAYLCVLIVSCLIIYLAVLWSFRLELIETVVPALSRQNKKNRA